MKKYLLLLIFVLPSIVRAGEPLDTSHRAKAQNRQIQSPLIADGPLHPLSFQVEAGTQGMGADIRYGLTDRFSLRMGANYIPVNYNSNFSISGFQTDYTASANFLNFHLLGDVVPFEEARGLRLVFGGAYLYKANTQVVLSPTGNYSFGNYNVAGSDVGVLNMDVSWKGLAPYLGMGLFKSFPNQIFNVNLDLGVYCMNAPSTHIVGTNMLVDDSQLEPQFNNNLKNWRWLPVLQLNFNFKIN